MPDAWHYFFALHNLLSDEQLAIPPGIVLGNDALWKRITKLSESIHQCVLRQNCRTVPKTLINDAWGVGCRGFSC